MRSLNSPLWGSEWQAVQVLSGKWNGRILSDLPPRPALWHDVGPGQHKAGILVLGDGERRAMKILHGVAVLATILVGSYGELLVMRIPMAIGASCELYVVDCVFSGRRVALIASDSRMFSFERIMRCRVLLHAK
jgi:hypothetical protein